jgi:hypothetical protein
MSGRKSRYVRRAEYVPAMLNISGNAALDVLIGLFFLYFLLSLVCSAINEGIAAAFRLRSKYLEKGLRKVLEGQDNLDAFFANPRVQALVKPPGRFIRLKRRPSYLSSRTFALTLLDTFAPPQNAAHSHDLIGRTKKALGHEGEATPGGGPPAIVRRMLQDALDEDREHIDRFRKSVERSFDEVMDRVSGWYKRRVQLILFIVAIALTAVMNADSFSIAQRLWKDPALRGAVVAQASQVVKNGKADCAQVDEQTPKTDAAANCVAEVKNLGLPLGWSDATSPHDFWSLLGKILGLLVTGFALSLGAPFWFDLLSKVSNLRGAGPAAPGAEEKSS